MKFKRTESGLFVVSFPPTHEDRMRDRRAEFDRYQRLHAVCPECGSADIESTCLGHGYAIDVKAEEMCDDNRAMCVCGWRGIVHDCGPSNGSDVE